MKNNLKALSLLLISVTLLFIACSKNNNDKGATTLNVRLTDDPADYDAVNIDLKEVRVKFRENSSDGGWQTLKTNAGVYNLLAYQKGDDTLVARGLITEKTIQQIRLILGTNNSISVGGVTYPLSIPSGSESGLKINFSKDITQPLETITLDFDALLSIKHEEDGYKLRPVIKVR